MNNYNRFDVNNLVTIRTLSSSQWKETMQCRAKSSAFNKKKLILKQYNFKDNVSLQLHTLQQRYKNKMTQNESTIINVVIQKKDGQTILNIIEEYQEHENISKYINPNWIFQIELLIKLVEQLSNLHQQQIYHLNLKPQNILINCKSDQYLFTDFNYPQLIYAYQLSQYRFSSIYMPPQGRQTYLLDGSADIWSLGIIFLEIILKHRIETVSTEDGSNLLESVKRIIAKVKDVNWRKLIEGMCRPFEERYTLEEVHQNLLNIKQRKNVNPPKIKILLPIFPFNDVKIKCNEDMLSDWFSSKRQIKQFQISLFLQKKDGSQVLYFCIKHLQSGIIIANTVYNQLPFASREHFEDIDSLYQQIINTDTNNLDFDSGGFISIRITNKSASQNESDAQTSKINEKEQLFQQQKQIFDKPQPQYNKESVQSQQISQLEKKPMNSSSINNKKIQDQSANQIQNAKDEQLQQLQQIEQLSDEEQTIEQQIKLLPGTNDQIKQTIKNLRIAYRLNEKYDLIPYYFEKLAFMYKEINDRSSAKFAFKFAKRLYFLYTKKREVAEVIMNLGIIYIQMQQSDKAINCFKLLIKYAKQCSISLQQPHYTTVAITGYKQLAKLYLLIQRYKLSQQCCIKSISLLDQALDNYKEDIQQIYIILSQLYFKSNSYTEAVESIQGALSYLNKQQKQVDLQAKLRYNLAFCYFSQGNIRQCLMKYCEMLQFAKKNKIEDSYQLQFIQFMRENYAQFNSIYKQNDESITSIKRILKRENAIKLQLILQKNDL